MKLRKIELKLLLPDLHTYSNNRAVIEFAFCAIVFLSIKRVNCETIALSNRFYYQVKQNN